MWGPCEEIFLSFFPSFIILFLCPSFFVCCDAFFFLLLGSLVIVNQKSSSFQQFSFFLSFFLSDREIQIPILSLSLSLSHSSLKKNAPPNAAPVPAFRARSIESRFVTSHREIQTTLLRHRRERERKKWRTFCSHRGCARVRDGTRTGNPSIRPPP